MSLDVSLFVVKETEVFEANITHNLGGMAGAAGLYDILWKPKETGIETATDLIQPLRDGLAILKSDPHKFKQMNPENGWGSYDGLVRFCESYLRACENNPHAKVKAYR